MKKITIIALSLLLTACGYQPLYKTGGPGALTSITQLQEIQVAPIDNRLGQVMYNRLLDIFDGTGAPNYLLTVTLKQKVEGYGFRADAAVTQEQVTVVATIKLVDIRDDSVAYEAIMQDRTSYDVVLSDFATATQREDAGRRLVKEIADQLHRRLALHFRGA